MNFVQPFKYLWEGRKLKYCAILATKWSFIIHAKFGAGENDVEALKGPLLTISKLDGDM